MRTQYPKEIDAWSAADRKKHLSFTLPITQCKRLTSLLASNQGLLDVVIDFSRLGRQAQALGHVKGTLSLVCQRCLSPMTFELSATINIAFVFNDKQAKLLDDSHEPMIVDEQGMVKTLDIIEEEILLSLPQFSMHQEDCQIDRVNHQTTLQESNDKQDIRENPFAILAQLKK